MNNNLLTHIFIFLAAASLIVPIASRFKLGSVLGYLIIGILIGPFIFNLVGNAEQIMSFSEFGIIMMLFLIGLDLEPARLWRLRKIIVGLGGLQVMITTAVLMVAGLLLQYGWRQSLAISMALALSSTALVLQMLQEKKLLQTTEGETSFSVLLFQDIAVIGMLIILPFLASPDSNLILQHSGGLLKHLPAPLHALLILSIIGVVMLTGRLFSQHLFLIIAKTNLREIFTATSLALVVGISLLMQLIGASPALGAFVAGTVLANSEYKRTLETDIEPFKGLLLGLFFISVGMGMNFDLFMQQPGTLLMMVAAIIIIKSFILIFLGYFFGLTRSQTIGFALSLSQVGEFAFVLFQLAQQNNVIASQTCNLFTFIVALSMAITPFLMLIYYRFIVPRYLSLLPAPRFDTIDQQHPVILAGYGRFGQVIGRFLTAQGVSLTILEKNPEQIELLRNYGFKGFFGDASRLDLLRNAGAERAKLLIIAIDDPETALGIVQLAKQVFPHLKIYARARNRRHAYELHKAGVDYFKRETFDSSLVMAKDVMIALGHTPDVMRKKAQLFSQHDVKSLKKSFEFFEKESELIYFAQQSREELERILQDDITPKMKND